MLRRDILFQSKSLFADFSPGCTEADSEDTDEELDDHSDEGMPEVQWREVTG